MQRHIATIVVLAAASAAHPFESLAQDAASRAALVLAEARKTLGGEEKLRAVKTLQASGDYRRAIGEMNMEGELEVILARPDKLRRNETIGVPGGATMLRTEVLNGDDVWDDTSRRGGMGGHMTTIGRGPGGREASEDQSKDMRRRARRAELARYMLAWLLATDAPVAYAGVAEAPDGKAHVVEVTPDEGPAIRLFIDEATHRPLVLSWKGRQPRMLIRRTPGGQHGPAQLEGDPAAGQPLPEATFEMRLGDYREVAGIRLPHLISRAVNGAVNEEWRIEGYAIDAKLEAGAFTPRAR